MDPTACVSALTATDYKGPSRQRPNLVIPTVQQIGNVMPTATRGNPNQGRVYDPTGLAPTLGAIHGGGLQPHIIEPDWDALEAQETAEIDKAIEESEKRIRAHGVDCFGKELRPEPCACLTPDRLEKRQNGRRFKEPGEPMFTLTKQDIHGVAITADGVKPNDTAFTLRSEKHGPHGVDANHPVNGALHNTRIRRLTPRECMRLQGLPDYITDKLIAAGISDTQMYRAAGDACTVNVIYEIARRL